MKLNLERMTIAGKAIIGDLGVDGAHECFTLENLDVSIPAGSYSVTVYMSPHAGHLVPLVENVPGRDYIEIHCGNQPCDSKGCVLVGQEHTPSTLENSRLAFDALFPKIMDAIKRLEPVTIQVSALPSTSHI